MAESVESQQQSHNMDCSKSTEHMEDEYQEESEASSSSLDSADDMEEAVVMEPDRVSDLQRKVTLLVPTTLKTINYRSSLNY
eukprot:gene14301-15789_t